MSDVLTRHGFEYYNSIPDGEVIIEMEALGDDVLCKTRSGKEFLVPHHLTGNAMRKQ